MSRTTQWGKRQISFLVRFDPHTESGEKIDNERADTGGDNFINAPMSVVEEYYRNVSGLTWGSQLGGVNCTVIVPCATELPHLQIYIGNGTVTIGRELMMGKPLLSTGNPSLIQGTYPCYGSEFFLTA